MSKDNIALDNLNTQIAQTKANIANLQSQLDNLNKPTDNTQGNKPSAKPAGKPTGNTQGNKPSAKPADKPTDNTQGNKPNTSTSTDNKTDVVLPGPDQIVVVPTVSSENDKSNLNDANKVVANISYNKGIDPLTNQLLSDETPAQQRKVKNYIENLNKSSEPVYNQPITFTFSEDTVKADNVKGNSEVKNELPTTGENQDKAATALGIEVVSMGLALGGLSFLKRKKKH